MKDPNAIQTYKSRELLDIKNILLLPYGGPFAHGQSANTNIVHNLTHNFPDNQGDESFYQKWRLAYDLVLCIAYYKKPWVDVIIVKIKFQKVQKKKLYKSLLNFFFQTSPCPKTRGANTFTASEK